MISTDRSWYKKVIFANEETMKETCTEETAEQAMDILFYKNGRFDLELLEVTMKLIASSVRFATFIAKSRAFQLLSGRFRDFIDGKPNRGIYCNVMNAILPRMAEVEPESIEVIAEDLYLIPECTSVLMTFIKYYNPYSHYSTENIMKWINLVHPYDAVDNLLSCYTTCRRKNVDLQIPEDWLFKTYYKEMMAVKLVAVKLCIEAFPDRVKKEYERMLSCIPKGGYIASWIINAVGVPPSNPVELLIDSKTTPMARRSIMKCMTLDENAVAALRPFIDDIRYVAVKRAVESAEKAEPEKKEKVVSKNEPVRMTFHFKKEKKPKDLIKFGSGTWINVKNIYSEQ